LSWSVDGGATWSDPWTPHEDGTPTEHGFVSIFSTAEGIAATWLDGRAMVEQPGGEPGAMSIRTRVLPIGRPAGPEIILDARTCECCQTDATVVDGVPVVAYRDRGDGEVRNIHVSRLLDTGWTEGQAIHDDGWVIGGCPVNGPALASGDGRLAIAWFAAPDDVAQVKVSFSSDKGASFGEPVRVDLGTPSGRVDLLALDDGEVLVSWLERRDGGAAVLSRRVSPSGSVGEIFELAATSEARASGFPRIARLGDANIVTAWTDPSGEGQVHVDAHALSEWGPAS